MEHIAGIDLHSDNGYYGIIEPDGNRIFHKRLPNNPQTILAALEPYRETLRCIVIESTYNWYWLADVSYGEGILCKACKPCKV